MLARPSTRSHRRHRPQRRRPPNSSKKTRRKKTPPPQQPRTLRSPSSPSPHLGQPTRLPGPPAHPGTPRRHPDRCGLRATTRPLPLRTSTLICLALEHRPFWKPAHPPRPAALPPRRRTPRHAGLGQHPTTFISPRRNRTRPTGHRQRSPHPATPTKPLGRPSRPRRARPHGRHRHFRLRLTAPNHPWPPRHRALPTPPCRPTRPHQRLANHLANHRRRTPRNHPRRPSVSGRPELATTS